MKTVYILRGVPGSGKTFLANVLKDALGAEIFSADDYFEKDGEYKFDREKLTEAHHDCFNRFVNALERDVECVVVHNTNTRFWEYQKYLHAAEVNEYEYVICDMQSSYRNIHGVPTAAIMAMRKRFEH